MDDQPFQYYQHPPPPFNSYSASQYSAESYEPGYTTNDGGPFTDHNFVGTPVQGGAQGWPASFPAAEDAPFSQESGVSDSASEHPRPEIDGGGRSARLRLDVNFGSGHDESHVQEFLVWLPGPGYRMPRIKSNSQSRTPVFFGTVTCHAAHTALTTAFILKQAAAHLSSPLDLRPQHSDSAITSAAYPVSANTYDATSTSPTFDMNHDRGRSGLLPSLTMPHESSYFMGMFPNQQLPPLSAYPGQRQQPLAHSHQYAPSRSPQHLHPASAPPYGSSTPRIGLNIPPYTPSSIASSSVRSVSPASTAATSAQPLDFSGFGSPPGEREVGIGEYALPAPSLSSLSLAVGSPHSPTVPGLSPTVRSSTMVTAGLSHSLVSGRSASGPDRSSANGHAVSPVRRRAGKQRLDDARRKEICTYARDRPKARQEDIALKYGVERSTISKILKNKDKWLTVDTHTRKPMAVKHRPSKFPEIETELLKWVKECQENGTGITDTRIKARARECAAEIGLPEGKFKASSGWIENFKVRNNLTKRSQDEQEASPTNEEHDDADQMDEDDDLPIQASQSTQIEDGDEYEPDRNGQDSFHTFTSLSAQTDSALAPLDTSYSTFSTDSVTSGSQDL
ncbi:hypothetical protein FRC09_016018, partial [Ceratobasidium sp. 395]